MQKELSCSEERTQKLFNELKSAEAEKKEVNQKLAEAEQRTEALEKQISDLQDKLEKKERGSKAEIDAMRKELTQLKKNLKRNEEKLKSVYEEKRRLEDKLKVVNAGKENLEKELNQAREDTEQIMVEKCQGEKCLKDQLRKLDQGYEVRQESYEQEIGKLKWEIEELENRYDEFKKYVAPILKEHKIEWKWICNLVKSLPKESQDSEEEREIFHDQIDEGYGSDKENCDNNLSSNISSISSVEMVAKSRNVEVA